MFIQKILFSELDCKKILELIIDSKKSDGYELYKHPKLQVSFDEYKIYDDENTKWFFDVIKNFIYENTKIKTQKLNIDANILKYGINDGFSKHNDFDIKSKNQRIYTVGILLNDDFEGGDLIIYEDEESDLKKTKTLNKIIGNCYIFESTIQHEVKKIIKGIRFSMIIHVRNSEIKKNNII